MGRRPNALRAPAAGVSGALALLAPAVARAAEDGLQIIPDPLKLVPLLVLFVVLVPILDVLLFRPLIGVLEERDRRIEGARVRAGELSQQAAALVNRHDAAMREARERAHADQSSRVEDARRQHQETIAEARTAAEREITAARVEIDRAAGGVRGSLGAEAELLAREIAARLLGKGVA